MIAKVYVTIKMSENVRHACTLETKHTLKIIITRFQTVLATIYIMSKLNAVKHVV